MSESKSTADQPYSPKELSNLVRSSIRDDIKVLWRLTDQQVPYTATDHITSIARLS
jgi:hypothetical protein